MHKIATPLFFIFGLAVSAVSAQSWAPLESGTSNDLKDVFFVNAQTGWIAGKNGTIRKTVNGGTGWTSQTSGTSRELKGLHFADAYTGWAVGKDGTVLKTTDGGNVWASKTNPAQKDLTSVSFYGASTGIAVGKNGTVITTSDGGNTWTARQPGYSGSLYGVQMLNASLAFACGENGRLLKTTDAGTTWTVTGATAQYDWIGMHFLSENKGYLVPESDGSDGGSGGILYKSSGGVLTALTLPTSKQLLAVFFTDENTGWAVGKEGRILRTANGGTGWTAQTLGSVSKDLVALHFVSSELGYAVGKDGTVLKYGTQTGGVPDNESRTASVYPNPVQDAFYIDLPQTTDDVQVHVSDLSGRQWGVWSVRTPENPFRVETSGWKPGIYIVRIGGGDRYHTVKIIKL